MNEVSNSAFKTPSSPSLLDIVAGLCLLAGPVFLFWLQGGHHSSVGWFCLATLGFGSFLWVINRTMDRSRLRIPGFAVLCAIIALMIGFLGVVNPPEPIADSFVALHQSKMAERWPATWVWFSPFVWWSVCAFGWMGALIGMDIVSRYPQWFAPAAGIVVLSVGTFGLIANAYGGPVSWMFLSEPRFSGYPFGGFLHYSLAASLFNLCWPVGLALSIYFLVGCVRLTRLWRISLSLVWFAFSAFLFLKVFDLTNRGAQAAAFVGFVVFGVIILLRKRIGLIRKAASYLLEASLWGNLRLGFGILLLGVCGWLLLAASNNHFQWGALEVERSPEPLFEPLPDRGDMMIPSMHPQRDLPFFSRRMSWATARAMVPDAGFTGFGPGAWSYRYSEYTSDTMMLSFFLHIHFVYNDLLRYLVEWGWVGGSAWIAFWVWVILRSAGAVLVSFTRAEAWAAQDWIRIGALVGLITCLVHGLVDYPLQSPGVLLVALAMAVFATSEAPTKGRQYLPQVSPPPAQSPIRRGRC